MKTKAYNLLKDIRHELGASILLVANENGEALLMAGTRSSETSPLLAALGAAGLSALQEMVAASFVTAEESDEQMLTLEVARGLIVIFSTPPLLFLAILPDKSRLGLARLLLRRLSQQCRWEDLLPTAAKVGDLPDLGGSDTSQLFANLWGES